MTVKDSNKNFISEYNHILEIGKVLNKQYKSKLWWSRVVSKQLGCQLY